MKSQLNNLILLLCLVTFSNYVVDAQPHDKKHDKEENNGNGKYKDKDKEKKEKNDRDDEKDDDKYNDRYKDKKNEKHEMEVANNANVYLWNGYIWDRNTFKNRVKIKNQEMVTICHKFIKVGEPNVTIRVSANAAKAHLRHGDVTGECSAPPTTKNRYSTLYINQRNKYYNTMETSGEQLAYSKSILDYALARLAQSQMELAILQKQKDRQAEVARKQAAVFQLQQNTSLLETMIGVTANLIVKEL